MRMQVSVTAVANMLDEDGDGFHEVHVNTMEGFLSLLRSWLRPHRGISQDHLPLYLGFFEFVHNVRRRGKALLGALLRDLAPVAPPERILSLSKYPKRGPCLLTLLPPPYLYFDNILGCYRECSGERAPRWTHARP